MSSFGQDFYQARQIICNYSVGFQINQTNTNTWGIINVAHPRDISYYQNYLTSHIDIYYFENTGI